MNGLTDVEFIEVYASHNHPEEQGCSVCEEYTRRFGEIEDLAGDVYFDQGQEEELTMEANGDKWFAMA